MELYDFIDLKKDVEKKFGIEISSKSRFKVPEIRIEISHTDVGTDMDITDSGIFYIDEKGRRIKGFLYIPIYNPLEWKQRGWNDMPKFHTLKCSTINSQIQRINFNGHYIFANTPILDLQNADGIEKDIIICGNCKRIENYGKLYTSTKYCDKILSNPEIEGNFYQKEIPIFIKTDKDGYTPKWAEKSRNYRVSKNFTCEECGIELNKNYSEGYYLETHHLNGNKTINSDDNLKCLCKLCHTFIDDIHLSNSKNSPSKLKKFVQTFNKRLKQVNNSHLSEYNRIFKRI